MIQNNEINRRSSSDVFLRKGILKICSKFAGEYSCVSVIFIKIALRHEWSPVNLLHIFRTPFYKDTYGGLLLH